MQAEQLKYMTEMARAAQKNAYTPYSHYNVGACVLAASGKYYSGCNIENSSFGLTCCAERNAVFAAACQGERSLSAIVITSSGSMPYPCGACRQVLREFARDMEVAVVDAQNRVEQTTLSALLPDSFGPESL